MNPTHVSKQLSITIANVTPICTIMILFHNQLALWQPLTISLTGFALAIYGNRSYLDENHNNVQVIKNGIFAIIANLITLCITLLLLLLLGYAEGFTI